MMEIMGRCDTDVWEANRLFFDRHELLRILSPDLRESLVRKLKPAPFRKGDIVIRQGDEGDALFLIQLGSCDVLVEEGNNLQHVVSRGPGEVVGEMALLTTEPRQAHVRAASEVMAWRLDKSSFEGLLVNNELRSFLTELVSARLQEAAFTADREIGKYLIKKKLGHGAWAIVYRGQHQMLNTEVAIKMLKHQMAMVPEFHSRFIKEAKTIAGLLHENIIRVYDIEDRFATLFIVMEFLDGQPLNRLLHVTGMPWPRSVNMLKQICSALSYAHGRGIIHQDIKPENIFVLHDDKVKLLDFGLACFAGSENIEMEGTPWYMAPEQIDSCTVDGRTDIYNLGIMAFEMVVGRRPFPEDDLEALLTMHKEQDIPDPADSVEIPEALSSFIKKACARNPAHRFQSADEALQVLNKIDLAQHTSIPDDADHNQTIHISYCQAQQKDVARILNSLHKELASVGAHLRAEK